MTDTLLGAAQSTTVRQHPSHRRLLDDTVVPSGRARIDAVIVPASRDVRSLEPIARLADELGCRLVALCSLEARAATIRSASWGSRVSAVNVQAARTTMPDMRTTALLRKLAVSSNSDTSLKRNLGLAVTHQMGWDRVLFLDDDISALDAGVLEAAASLLDGGYGTVGLDNTGYPDNSVVCHANRETGGDQSTFVGGGAMIFPRSRTTSFFPHIYNEDWFFLLTSERVVDVAVHGTFAQEKYDPYANPRRAGNEEFGDCLAEGLFALLDNGHKLGDADVGYWRDFIEQRRLLIDSILRRVPAVPVSALRGQRMAAALRAARDQLGVITAHDLVSYMSRWRSDRSRWEDFIGTLQVSGSIEQAFDRLGLTG